MSIADALSDAVADIDRYRADDGPVGSQNLDAAVVNVRDSMELLRCRLDVDLHGSEPTARVAERVGGPAFIPVAASTLSAFYAQLDELELGADAYVRRLLDADERLQRIAACATAAGVAAIDAVHVRRLAVGVAA